MKPVISGTTKVFGVVAHPIDHVRVQFLFNEYFEKEGMDAVFIPVHVKPGNAAKAMEGFKALSNFGGMVITIPHKVTFMDLVDKVLPTAALAGATNIIRPEEDGSWTGNNLDGMGFVNGLADQIFSPKGKSFLVVGTGGAGSAIAATLAQSEISRLTISDLDGARAEALAGRLRGAVPDLPISVEGPGPNPAGYDVVVNATPLGMHEDDPMPIDPDLLEGDTVVAEVVQVPPVTRLLKEAEARGHRTLQGGSMLDYQFIEMARFFRTAE
ncbi:shikimate dehydrogenase family protein [Aliiruegeria sabulilitoris]|uniref:shikimate dehydrogenase family protein n=1 Tax=Aliiruegeria sabulilitoris TaxID=1510458 RepID=UPI00082E333D|nr:shikimate dehydrogenase [Aliiruegeria sabulilitoris]